MAVDPTKIACFFNCKPKWSAAELTFLVCWNYYSFITVKSFFTFFLNFSILN